MNTASQIRFDFLDISSAWSIQRTVGETLCHDPKCSSVEGSNGGIGGPALLCDCGAVVCEWLRMKDEEMGVTDDDLRQRLAAATDRTTDARVKTFRVLRESHYSHWQAFRAARQIVHAG